MGILCQQVTSSYASRKLGAENKTANVAISVNNVKMIRHNRSTTIAANFQSFVITLSSSSFRSCKKKTYVQLLNSSDALKELVLIGCGLHRYKLQVVHVTYTKRLWIMKMTIVVSSI